MTRPSLCNQGNIRRDRVLAFSRFRNHGRVGILAERTYAQARPTCLALCHSASGDREQTAADATLSSTTVRMSPVSGYQRVATGRCPSATISLQRLDACTSWCQKRSASTLTCPEQRRPTQVSAMHEHDTNASRPATCQRAGHRAGGVGQSLVARFISRSCSVAPAPAHAAAGRQSSLASPSDSHPRPDKTRQPAVPSSTSTHAPHSGRKEQLHHHRRPAGAHRGPRLEPQHGARSPSRSVPSSRAAAVERQGPNSQPWNGLRLRDPARGAANVDAASGQALPATFVSSARLLVAAIALHLADAAATSPGSHRTPPQQLVRAELALAVRRAPPAPARPWTIPWRLPRPSLLMTASLPRRKRPPRRSGRSCLRC